MRINQLPGAVIDGYLAAGRIPLRAVARVSGEQGNEQWPPAVAYEGVTATVETVLGSLLHDESLAEKGRLRQAKVGQLREAAELQVRAEAAREQADEEFTARRKGAEQKRQQAARRAEHREQQVEQTAEERKREIDRKAASKTAATRRTKAAQDKAVDKQERAAKTQSLRAEERALAEQQEALETAEKVDLIEDTIEGNKEARTGS